MKQCTNEFAMKLGTLLGSLDHFLVRVGNNQDDISGGDIDRLLTLSKDVARKFYELPEEVS